MKALSPDTRQLITFINSLAGSSELTTWSLSFCRNLQRLLGDVDDVGLHVLFSADLRIERGLGPELTITMRIPCDEGRGMPDFKVDRHQAGESPHKAIIEQYRTQNPVLTRKYNLYGYDYYYGNGEYLGSIILWRGRHRRAMSQRSVELMNELEPFFVFALSDAVTRYYYFQPVAAAFVEVIDGIVKEAGLTDREQEALILHMYGLPYNEIAEKLKITIAAVKKRIIQIHRKTGVTSQSELFARYFTALAPNPRVNGAGGR